MDFNSCGAESTAISNSDFSTVIDEFEADDLFFEYANEIPDDPSQIKTVLDEKLLEKPIRNQSRVDKIQTKSWSSANQPFSPIVYFDIETTGLGEFN